MMCDLVKGRNDVWFGWEIILYMWIIGVVELDISFLFYFKVLVIYCYKLNF